MSDYFVIDDFDEYNELFDHMMGSDNVPFFYRPSVVDDPEERMYFTHCIQKDVYNTNGVPQIFSQLFFPVYNMVYDLCKQYKIQMNGMYRAAINANTPTEGKNIYIPHVDSFTPTTQLLFYLNDSDGETILYDEVHSGSIDQPNYLEYEPKEIARIEPKRNRVLIFNGLRFHNAVTPSKNTRFVLVTSIF